MPLVKRLVEPIYIGRSPLDKQIKNELEGVVVNSLAGVIKQLSSISKHAENLFGDLIDEANNIFQRSTALTNRVQILYEKTSRLDSGTKEDVKVEDFSLQNHFRSDRKEEQQVLARNTLPQALQEVYKRCEAPPNLNVFTPYREDSKEGLKFYTDPNYFYDLWVQSQQQMLEKKKKKGKKHRKKKSDQKKKVQQVNKRVYHAVDKEFIGEQPSRAPPPPPTAATTATPQQPSPQVQHTHPDPVVPAPPPPMDASNTPTMPRMQQTPPMEHSLAQDNRPGAAPPPPPPPPGVSAAQLGAPIAPPPPPPPPTSEGYMMPPPPPPPQPGPSMMMPPPPPPPQGEPTMYPPTSATPYMAPPPPPPSGPVAPPPPPPPGAPPPPMPPVMNAGPPPPPPPSVQPAAAPAKPVDDSRSALLQAIEMGKKLRKVERTDEEKKHEYGGDVASILKRRIAIQESDTESDSEGSESDSDWSD